MAKRDEIVRYTNEYLGLHYFKDYGPMGLQFIGKNTVRGIATCVSANQQAIFQANALGVEMLIAHHGLFWNTEPRVLDQRMSGRISLLQHFEMSLCGYHLCLDAHPIIGNNVLAAESLGLENLRPFGEIGWGGELPEDQNIFVNIVDNYSPILYTFPYGPKEIKRAAVIVGGGANYIHDAKREGYDLFFTGEPAEPSRALAQELEIHFIAAGHHATEKAGVRALGDRLAEQFDIPHYFIDVNNPV